MNRPTPPPVNATTTIQIQGFPVRLWWKLLETAQLKGVKANYLVLSILAQALDFEAQGESYDLVVKEIEEQLKP